MIRATIDTNTLASGAIAQKGVIATLIDAWRQGNIEFVLSEHILIELERTLRKPYFAARLDERDRRAFLALLLEYCAIVELRDPIPVVLVDEADNLVLATALAGKAPYLVSGDRELQRLGTFQQVNILSAREFVDLMGW
ncbi:MAG: putative toxin-antitoxin system toxin component, PIN family [Thermomicrobiales bacterium]|nr:putative toxin-antitoxin system toxin component, PIN family [Thermomicrobiales bacterium]